MIVISFISQLKARNEFLFYYGILCFVAALFFLIMSKVSPVQYNQVSAWYKPFKFAFSTFTFAWAMAWYCYYLPTFNVSLFNWSVSLLLSFEIVYIAIMASQGKASHYNVSSPLFSILYSMMALAATLVTLYTAYVGLLFFTNSFPELPHYYLWSIRLGIFIFVVFSFEGFLMGSRMNHSVGLLNDNSTLFILGWSKKVGDLRIAHFVGMHALQVLPILSFYVLKNTRLTWFFAFFYVCLALFVLIQALNGKPLIPAKVPENNNHIDH